MFPKFSNPNQVGLPAQFVEVLVYPPGSTDLDGKLTKARNPQLTLINLDNVVEVHARDSYVILTQRESNHVSRFLVAAILNQE